VFDELNARAWASPVRAAVHSLAVDAYAMQHVEEYGRSAKSYAAHLLGLLCGVEHPGDRQLYWSIARWLDGPKSIEKPSLLVDRGRLTIADVRLSEDAAYAAAVRPWAAAVWEAYNAQHPQARQWFAAIRGK